MQNFFLEFKDKDQEAAYIDHYDMQKRVFTRISMILSAIAWFAGMVYFYFFYPEFFLRATYIYLFALMPLVIFTIIITYKSNLVRFYQPSSAFADFVAGIFCIYIGFNEIIYLSLIVVITVAFFAFFVLMLRIKLAIITTFSYLFIYQIAIINFPTTTEIKVLMSLAIWTIESSCIISGYVLESSSRQLFIQGLKIEEQQQLLAKEREKSERLLQNILPVNIAERLKNNEKIIADKHSNVSVLFADIVNFTSLSQRLSAEEIVNLLDEIFSIFDNLVEKYGLEKIKTIGDAYMVVAGLTPGQRNHRQDIVNLAVDMISATQLYKNKDISIRIGIHTGPVVAGVIGKKKFLFDLWGDTVNTASRMESHGLPNHIQITEETFEFVKEDYPFTDRGLIDIKGKGEIRTYIYQPPSLEAAI